MHLSIGSKTKLTPNVWFVSLCWLHFLSQVLSQESGQHKIESSHSNQIKSFDDTIYFKINWLSETTPEVDRHIHKFSQYLDDRSNDPKVWHIEKCCKLINVLTTFCLLGCGSGRQYSLYHHSIQ